MDILGGYRSLEIDLRLITQPMGLFTCVLVPFLQRRSNMKKPRTAAFFLFALLVLCLSALIVSCASSGGAASASDMEAAGKNDAWFNLQNFHYLEWFYEKDGELVYGDVDLSSDEALWSFTKASRRKGLYDVYAIRNKGSGNYVMPVRNSDRVAVTEAEDPFAWSWWAGPYGIVLGDSKANAATDPATDNIICIHMEGKKGYAENSLINRTWGTPNWLLHEHGEPKYWAVKSEDTGLYLYEDGNDTLRLGDKADMDSRYYWIYENINNIISIKNRRTGHTISVENIFNEGAPNLSLPVKVINSLQHWKTNRWVLTRTGSQDIVNIESGFDELKNFRLYHKPAGDNYVYLSDTVLPTSAAAQWRQEEVDSGSLRLVIPEGWIRLRNSARGDYLYELPESRGLVNGSVENNDPRSHWRLVRDEQSGCFRLRSRNSGYDAVLAATGVVRMTEPEQGGDEALWEPAYAAGNENLVIRNRANPAAYLNLDKNGEKGYAEAGAQSPSAGHTQWMIEEAGNAGASPAPVPLAPSQNRIARLEELRRIPAESVFRADDALKRKNEIIFSVFAPGADSYPVSIVFQPGAQISGEVFVNGVRAGALAAALNLPLKAGINTVSLRSKNIGKTESLTVRGGAGIARRGATVPWRQYEAETMTTNAEILPDSRVYRQITSEASGRGAVKLEKQGDYVEFTAEEPLNSLVLRYCIPDAEKGGGIEATLGLYADGERIRDLQLTSKYSWVYGNYPWSNTPDNLPHRFFDDSRFLLDSTLPAGTVIRLQRDARDTAEYYIIDLADTENVPPPSPMPANALSITDFGAAANDGQDDTAALMRCINAAARQKKEVWIPTGEFNFTNARPIEITKKGLIIRGAGPWYSVLRGMGAGFMIKANDVSFYDFSLIGEETARNDALGRAGFENSDNTNSARNVTIQNIWMEHLKVGVWVYRMNAMLVTGCRIRNTFADGINLCAGSAGNILEQNAIRNTGDDSIALWSWTVFRRNDADNRIRFNTAGLQWLANNVAVYGGQDNEITDNILHDTVAFGAGIAVSAAHDPVDFRGTVTAKRNTLLRCGGHEYNFDQDFGAIWILPLKEMDVSITLADNDIIDSSYQGISVLGGLGGHAVKEIIVENNSIDTCGTWGINIGRDIPGKLILKDNIISGAMIGPFYNAPGDGMSIPGNP